MYVASHIPEDESVYKWERHSIFFIYYRGEPGVAQHKIILLNPSPLKKMQAVAVVCVLLASARAITANPLKTTTATTVGTTTGPSCSTTDRKDLEDSCDALNNKVLKGLIIDPPLCPDDNIKVCSLSRDPQLGQDDFRVFYCPDGKKCCPDNKSCCPVNQMCCEQNDGSYGCCPMDPAICCDDDSETCCPKGYTCTTDLFRNPVCEKC